MNSRLPDELYRTDAEWERWGEHDPYFGVITDPRFRRESLTPEVLAEFFQTGRSHLAHVMQVCHRHLVAKFAPKRALDFGCGTGRVLVGMGEKFPEAVGVDVSAAMLEEARKNCVAHGLTNVTLAPSDDELSAVEGTFDLIHSVIVFQHIDPARGHRLVPRLMERLRPGGIAVLHFTYAKAYHPDTFGQPPAPPPAQAARSLWPRRTVGRDSTATQGDPEMLMHSYPLNELLFSIQRCGARRMYVEFTDHGGEMGVILYFCRSVK